jgi:hypothetical protein
VVFSFGFVGREGGMGTLVGDDADFMFFDGWGDGGGGGGGEAAEHSFFV